MLSLHMAIAEIRAGKCRLAILARERGLACGTRVKGRMSLEVFMSGKPRLADDALEGLKGGPGGTRDRHDAVDERKTTWRR